MCWSVIVSSRLRSDAIFSKGRGRRRLSARLFGRAVDQVLYLGPSARQVLPFDPVCPGIALALLQGIERL